MLLYGTLVWPVGLWEYPAPQKVHPVSVRHGLQLLIHDLQNRRQDDVSADCGFVKG